MASKLRDAGLPRVYARAMLDLAEADEAGTGGKAGASGGQADQLLAELTDLAGVIAADADLAAFLGSPLVGAGERAAVLEKALRGRASDLLVDALLVINRKGRLALLTEIIAAYRAAVRELHGVVDVQVTSAVALTAARRKELIAALAKFTGKQPELAERVEPSILGGLVIEVGGEKIDSSLATQVRKVGAALALRAAQELHGGRSKVVEGA
jgi:F-type H+-transporting ATPase subunit delta